MTIVRIADIPPDERYLLPVSDLRRQIREDGNRPRSPNSWIDQGRPEGSRRGRAVDAQVPAAGLSPAAVGSFVTDWQMEDDLRPGSRFPLNREEIDEPPFDDEDFDDSDDEDSGEDDDRRFTGGRLATVP
jgi:hypothetical protein